MWISVYIVDSILKYDKAAERRGIFDTSSEVNAAILLQWPDHTNYHKAVNNHTIANSIANTVL